MMTSASDSSDAPLKGQMEGQMGDQSTNPVFDALQRLWAVEQQQTSIPLAQDMPSLPLCWDETRERDLCFLSSQFPRDSDLYKFIVDIKESGDLDTDIKRENSAGEFETESIRREHQLLCKAIVQILQYLVLRSNCGQIAFKPVFFKGPLDLIYLDGPPNLDRIVDSTFPIEQVLDIRKESGYLLIVIDSSLLSLADPVAELKDHSVTARPGFGEPENSDKISEICTDVLLNGTIPAQVCYWYWATLNVMCPSLLQKLAGRVETLAAPKPQERIPTPRVPSPAWETGRFCIVRKTLQMLVTESLKIHHVGQQDMERVYSLIPLDKDREDLLICLSFLFPEATEFLDFFFNLEKSPEHSEVIQRSIENFRNQEKLISGGRADGISISGVKREIEMLSATLTQVTRSPKISELDALRKPLIGAKGPWDLVQLVSDSREPLKILKYFSNVQIPYTFERSGKTWVIVDTGLISDINGMFEQYGCQMQHVAHSSSSDEEIQAFFLVLRYAIRCRRVPVQVCWCLWSLKEDMGWMDEEE